MQINMSCEIKTVMKNIVFYNQENSKCIVRSLHTRMPDRVGGLTQQEKNR
jgi:hypothetical protein